ncbi:MAG: ATP-binding protein [Candidatus Enteromonas sp.]
MENKRYKMRLIEQQIQTHLEVVGAVLIEGPKYCGKTWTGKALANSVFPLNDSADGQNNRQLAILRPSYVLEGKQPRLIDEWQEVPALWDAVRSKVDETGEKGQFILTGSNSVDKSSYMHSGTGRFARIRMRPMSLFESGESSGEISLLAICEGKAPDCFTGAVDLDSLLECILIGGWPSLMDASAKEGELAAKNYIRSVIDEDLSRIDKVKRDKHKFELLLRSLARNEATTATNATIQRDIKEKDHNDISINTIMDYFGVLRSLFLIENIPPFSSNIRSSLRLKQSEKRHFVDPSLPCALLGLTKEKMLGDLELTGFLFESLVERDLLIYCDAIGAKLFHYQDYKNKEIDAVIEMDDGSWCAFEIKLGAHQIDAAAANLLKINEEIEKEGGKKAKTLCVICGLTSAAYMRADGVYVVPITSLKN